MKKWLTESCLLIGVLSLVCCGYLITTTKGIISDFNRYQLTSTTQSLLYQIKQPSQLHLYTQDIDLYHQVEALVRRYQIIQPNIQFTWQKQAYLGNQSPAVLVLTYHSQQQIIEINRQLSEAQLTQAFFKLQRKHNQWMVFLQGHNEPSPFGKGNRDFQLLRMALENQGLRIQRLNLMETPFIPDNTQVLIIASPKSEFLPAEQAILTTFIDKGGDLLWLIDPDSHPLPFLSQQLGIAPLPGTIIDLHGQRLGTPHPAITLIEHYTQLPFEAPNVLTAFPWATALKQQTSAIWQTQPLLMTHETCWTQTGNLNGPLNFSPKSQEMAGPLLLGIGLSRSLAHKKEAQRVAVIGNSRFLSNGAIENYGNLALGLNVLNWLAHDDTLLNIQQPVVADTLLQLHLTTALLIKYGFASLNVLLLLGVSGYFYYRKAQSDKIASSLLSTTVFKS